MTVTETVIKSQLETETETERYRVAKTIDRERSTMKERTRKRIGEIRRIKTFSWSVKLNVCDLRTDRR